MGVYGGLAPMTNAVMWIEAFIFSFFVGLRLYTRKQILNSIGIDDYLVCFALVGKRIIKILVLVADML